MAAKAAVKAAKAAKAAAKAVKAVNIELANESEQNVNPKMQYSQKKLN
jgi:hypothetical protein